MRVITAESLGRRRQALLCRRRFIASSALVGAGAVLAGPASVAAQDGTPAATGSAAATTMPRNPWEPAWSNEPPFFEVINRDDATVTVNSFQDGEQELPAGAERIFLMSGEEDILIALGLEDRIVGVVADTDGVLYYTNQAVAESHLDLDSLVLSTNIYEPDLELILSARPDLILGQGQWVLTDELYPMVAPIAPTLRYPQVTFTYPRRAVQDFGTLFGVEDRADAALTYYNDTMQRAREAIAPVVADTEALTLWYQGDGVFIVYPSWSINADTGGIEPSSSVSNPIFFELGLKPLAAVEALADEDRSEYYIQMSLEQFGQLDADYIFVSGDPELIANDMLTSPIVQSMRAVRDDNLVVIDDTGSLGLGYHGNLAQVSLIVEALTGEPFA